jgi:hypothetical protein
MAPSQLIRQRGGMRAHPVWDRASRSHGGNGAVSLRYLGGERASPRTLDLAWPTRRATALLLRTCYVTFAVIAMFGTTGVAILLEMLWPGVIVDLLALAIGCLGLGLLRHRRPWPLLIGILGTAVVYAVYVRCDGTIELAGFALLYLATFLGWRAGKKRREPKGDPAWLELPELDKRLELDSGLTDVHVGRPNELNGGPVLDARNTPIDVRWM